MIRLSRDAPEPLELEQARERHLARLRQLIKDTGKDPSSDEIHGYKAGCLAKRLWEAQHQKCCYCEKKIECGNEDVEHFRPKARADRSPGCPDTHGYWWLAYTWDNLLFSCRQCNNKPAKGDRFPLEAGSQALKPEQLPPGKEQALLIHPLFVDPLEHIEFKPITMHRKERWRPTPRNGSQLGKWTIDVCDLNRLEERYTDHVNKHIRPNVEELRKALADGEPKRSWRIFNTIQRNWLGPQSEFTALSLDALRYLLPDCKLPPGWRWDLYLFKVG